MFMERHKILALGLATLIPLGAAAASAAQTHTQFDGGASARELRGAAGSGETGEAGEAAETREANDQAGDRTGLFAIEDRAEAIAEGEKRGAAALAAGHEVVTRWPGVRATLAQNGAIGPALASADAAVKALAIDLRSHGDLRRDANEVTGALAPLFGITGDKVPGDVHRLDYLGRSLGLDARSSAWARAKTDAAALAATWARLRPIVQARRGGDAVAARYDAATSQATAAAGHRDAKAAAAASKMSGDAVDSLEKLWA
ncbi:MAG: hypothetical protein NVS3B7_07950 [Candidatus Elarobacter sp.]